MQPLTTSPLALFASLTPAERERTLRATARASDLSVDSLKELLLSDWRIVGRPKQQIPDTTDWSFWWLLAGRGFGKTLSGAEWAKRKALSRRCRMAMVAPTLGDVRDTMVEGETGLLSILPPSALLGMSREAAWNKSRLELTLANGSKLKGFSSEIPDRLRGPQHDYVWCEEVSSWKDAHKGDVLDSTWSNVKLGCRLGQHPQVVLTSTPKANRLTKVLAALNPNFMRIVRGSSYENRENLSEAWWQVVVAPYEGTRMGRQEIEAEILEDVEGALWSLSQIDRLRVTEAPAMRRVVVGVDPNTSSGETADEAGVVVVGHGQSDKLGYVLADRTRPRGGPRVWARAAVDAYYEFEADRIVAEANNGGEMVELTIHGVDPTVPVKIVHASRGKRTRAEPVSALYEGDDNWDIDPVVRQPQMRHVGTFPELEEEMTTWTPEQDSPNRMDALVWAVTDLKLWAPPPKAMTSSVPRGRIPGVTDRARSF